MSVEKKKSIGIKEIILTAVITGIVTSLFQFWLMNESFSKERELWKDQYKTEFIDNHNQQKMKYLEEINESLLQLEIKAKEIKLLAAGLKAIPIEKDAEKLNDLMVQYHKDLFILSSKAQMATYYFGPEVDNVIPELSAALTKNYNNNLIFIEGTPDLPEFNLDFETIEELTNTRIKLLNAMYEDITETYQVKKQIIK